MDKNYKIVDIIKPKKSLNTLDLLYQEQNECDELTLRLFIERDLCIILQDHEGASEHEAEITALRKRKNALADLIQREIAIKNGMERDDFVCTILIQSL